MTDTIESLRTKLAEAEALLADCSTMLDGEEPSVREEHADLIDRVDAYQFSGLPAPEPVIHEYAFDCTLTAAIRVKATSEAEARGIMKGTIDSSSANLGAWPNGDPILCEISLDTIDAGSPYEIDGEEV